jgi:hypothetical protein
MSKPKAGEPCQVKGLVYSSASSPAILVTFAQQSGSQQTIVVREEDVPHALSAQQHGRNQKWNELMAAKLSGFKEGEQSAWAQAIERAAQYANTAIPDATEAEVIARGIRSLQPNPNWLREYDKQVAAKARLEGFDLAIAHLEQRASESHGRANIQVCMHEVALLKMERNELEREALK